MKNTKNGWTLIGSLLWCKIGKSSWPKTGQIQLRDLSVGRVDDIIRSTKPKPWSIELHGIVDRYERDGDADMLIKEIELIGKQVGASTEAADADIDYDKMKLVGAIFITPPQKSKSNDALDGHV